jgi:diguanylate cyclase (GGDEF)-like protein/PAS domain S-box-containing protein
MMKDQPVILVVDDQIQNIELLEAFLVPQGYAIVKAANGKEAMDQLSANQIDLILMDIIMPGIDGFEVTRMIRQDEVLRQLPIVLVTVLQEVENRIEGIEAGCDDFISKPIDKTELLARVRSLLKIKDYNDLMNDYRKELEVTKKSADDALEYAESIINTVRDSLIVLDQDLRVVKVSRSFYDVFKVIPEETVGQLIYDLGNKQWDIPMLRELLETILPQKATFDNYEVEHDFTTIGKRIMLLNARQIHRVMGKDHIILLSIEDITERKQLEEKIQFMAFHDTLTGLPNRKLFSDRLSIAMAHAERNKTKVGIMMLDLDGFKDVNDTLGHDAGDIILTKTAERLSESLRKEDTVARFGGDEFVLILPDIDSIEDAVLIAQKIIDRFSEPIPVYSSRIIVTTSIGIAEYPEDGTEEGVLLKNADAAMYQAKQSGRARFRLFNKI